MVFVVVLIQWQRRRYLLYYQTPHAHNQTLYSLKTCKSSLLPFVPFYLMRNQSSINIFFFVELSMYTWILVVLFCPPFRYAFITISTDDCMHTGNFDKFVENQRWLAFKDTRRLRWYAWPEREIFFIRERTSLTHAHRHTPTAMNFPPTVLLYSQSAMDAPFDFPTALLSQLLANFHFPPERPLLFYCRFTILTKA